MGLIDFKTCQVFVNFSLTLGVNYATIVGQMWRKE